MNNVIKILLKIGQYVYRNSIWIFPLVETTYKQLKKIIKQRKDERRTNIENQESSRKN